MLTLSIIMISVSLFFVCCAGLLSLLARILPGGRRGVPGDVSDGRKKPFVSVILPCYCEEDNIEAKLRNIYETTLMRDEFEVIVGLDESPDRTADKVAEFKEREGCENLRLEILPNKGKCQAINSCALLCRGDVVIAVDADTKNAPDAFEIIRDRFARDQKLGCLSSVPEVESDCYEAAYWRQEIRVRAFESDYGLMPIVTGWLYSFKKSAFVPIPTGVIADDLWVPNSIGICGLKVCQDERVRVASDVLSDIRELKRRRRIYRGGIECIRALGSGGHLKSWKRRIVLFLHKEAKWQLGFWGCVLSAGLALLAISLSPAYGAAFTAVLFGIMLVAMLVPHIRYKIAALLIPILSYKDSLIHPSMTRWQAIRDETGKA